MSICVLFVSLLHETEGLRGTWDVRWRVRGCPVGLQEGLEGAGKSGMDMMTGRGGRKARKGRRQRLYDHFPDVTKKI